MKKEESLCRAISAFAVYGTIMTSARGWPGIARCFVGIWPGPGKEWEKEPIQPELFGEDAIPCMCAS